MTQINQEVQIETQEHLTTPEEVLEFLAFIGNDERKILTLLALDQAGEPLGKTGLFRTLEDLCGGQIPGDLSQPFEYCEDSLSAPGAVSKTTTTIEKFGKIPTQVRAFETTQKGTEFGVPFGGALLKWSLEHNDLSLKILGATSSRWGIKAPITRYWALYDLATSPDSLKGPSVKYLAENIAIDSNTRMLMVRRFEQLGLVDKENSQDTNNRLFRIIQPEYIGGERKPKFERLRPETQLLFSTFKRAYGIKNTWKKDEFLKYMMDIYPEIDTDILKKVRLRLDNALQPSSTNLRGVVEDISGRNYEGVTRVTLKPDVAKAVNELVTIVDQFCSNDPAIFEKGKEFAKLLTQNPQAFRMLYEKAFNQSNLAIRDEGLDERLMNIVISSHEGMATARGIRDAYFNETGRNISTGMLNKKLGELVAKGTLQAEDGFHSKLKQNKIRYYSIPKQRD